LIVISRQQQLHTSGVEHRHVASTISTARKPLALHASLPADEAITSSEDEDSTDSDNDCTCEESNTADDNSSEESDTNEAVDKSDSSTCLGLLQEAAAEPPPISSQAASSCQHSLDHTQVLSSAAQQQQQQQDPETDAAAVQQQGCSLSALDEPQEAWADLDGIQLAAGSCCLSHAERAHLRRQLAAGLEEQKTAAVLERALENDPLLAMSLS
jgi:hypothetical protein